MKLFTWYPKKKKKKEERERDFMSSGKYEGKAVWLF